jgi:hypothetical protein
MDAHSREERALRSGRTHPGSFASLRVHSRFLVLAWRQPPKRTPRLGHGILDSVKSHAMTPCGCPLNYCLTQPAVLPPLKYLKPDPIPAFENGRAHQHFQRGHGRAIGSEGLIAADHLRDFLLLSEEERRRERFFLRPPPSGSKPRCPCQSPKVGACPLLYRAGGYMPVAAGMADSRYRVFASSGLYSRQRAREYCWQSSIRSNTSNRRGVRMVADLMVSWSKASGIRLASFAETC